jgi:tetrahydromethanopterin S-methyltransferase subunit G
MERINFDNGNKKVQVNEDGDFIILPMGDNSFPKRLIEFSEKMELTYGELIEKEKELAGSDITILSEMRAELYTRIGCYFDEIFGIGSCKKVFGNLAPAQYLMFDFLEQIQPLVGKFASERRATIEKKYQAKGR